MNEGKLFDTCTQVISERINVMWIHEFERRGRSKKIKPIANIFPNPNEEVSVVREDLELVIHFQFSFPLQLSLNEWLMAGAANRPI